MNSAVKYSIKEIISEFPCLAGSFFDLDIGVAGIDIAYRCSDRIIHGSLRMGVGYVECISLSCRNGHIYRDRHCGWIPDAIHVNT